MMKKVLSLFLIVIISITFKNCGVKNTPISTKKIDTYKDSNSRDKLPLFSWNSIPIYIHVRKAIAFTDDEIRFIAKHPLITFEKTTGNKTSGSTEAGTIEAAVAVKKLNPNSKILYYKNVVVNWPTYEEDEKFLKVNPNAYLTNSNLEKVVMPNKKTSFFDISQKPVQNYWIDHVTKVTSHPAIDGLFLDANIKVLVPAFFTNRVGSEKQKNIKNGYLSMMTELQNQLGKNNLLIANIIRVRPEFKEAGLEYLHFFDGSYIEGFEHENFEMTYADYLAKGILTVQEAARSGKIVAMSLGIGDAIKNAEKGFDDKRGKVKLNKELKRRIDYLLAIFLICAEKYSYVYPHDGYAAENSAVWLKTFSQYEKKLGAPKGIAKKNGYIYTRSFEYLDVWLDIESKKAILNWK